MTQPIWDLSCTDWERRIRAGESLIPDLPLITTEADLAVEFYNNLQLPDVPGTPFMREASGEWFRDIVRAALGSWDPVARFRYIRDIFAMVPKGSSKALALDTPIATPSGFTTMGEVKVGDVVIDSDGKPTRVTAKSAVFIGSQCFEVEFSTGEVVVCDAEHLWVTDAHRDRDKLSPRHRRGEPCPTVKRTADIGKTLKVPSGAYQINNHRTALCGVLDLPRADLPMEPYAFGVWLGDGSSEGARVTAGLDDADALVERLVANGQPAYVSARYPTKGSVTISLGLPDRQITGRGKGVRAALVRMGVRQNKHIPACYLRASAAQRLDLLQGLMDTDGHITTLGMAGFSTTKPALRDGVVELINSLGFKATWSEHRATIYGRDCGPVWCIRFHPFDRMPVFKMPRKLARQAPRVPKTKSLASSRQIVDVRPCKTVPVQCISVESETHQYLITRSLIPTHNTTNSAALMITMMLMNQRPRAEMLFVGPTQAISDRAYDQAAGMIELSPDLKKRFRTRDHLKVILDLFNQAEMAVKTFDLNILTGSIPVFVLLDELHLLGKSPHTTKVLRQIRGGLDKTPEGLLLITTTQSDEKPAGAFKDELQMARDVRDGKYRGKVIRPMLPVLYEYPADIAADREQWENPDNWPMVMPNLGRSVHMNTLLPDWESEKTKGDHAVQVWASQHLNIEIGVGTSHDSWIGGKFWAAAVDETLTLETLIERSEVIVVGIDGGGMDDLLGFTALGREKGTKRWLWWSRAWAHESVKKQRKEIVSRLNDFAAQGDLIWLADESDDDVKQVADLIEQIEASGKLADEKAIGVDPVGVADIVDELELRGFDIDDETGPGRIVAVKQGWTLVRSIKTAERRLAGGRAVHADQDLMDWCVGNAKTVPSGNAVIITKAVSGVAKIDPLMAGFNCVELMIMNPTAGGKSVFDALGELDEAETGAEQAQSDAAAMRIGADGMPTDAEMRAILSDPMHPKWQVMRERFEEALEIERASRAGSDRFMMADEDY